MPSSRHVGHRWGAVRGALCRVSARKQAQSGQQPAPRFRAFRENVPCGHRGRGRRYGARMRTSGTHRASDNGTKSEEGKQSEAGREKDGEGGDSGGHVRGAKADSHFGGKFETTPPPRMCLHVRGDERRGAKEREEDDVNAQFVFCSAENIRTLQRRYVYPRTHSPKLGVVAGDIFGFAFIPLPAAFLYIHNAAAYAKSMSVRDILICILMEILPCS